MRIGQLERGCEEPTQQSEELRHKGPKKMVSYSEYQRLNGNLSKPKIFGGVKSELEIKKRCEK